jgi:hypothetical protein
MNLGTRTAGPRTGARGVDGVRRWLGGLTRSKVIGVAVAIRLTLFVFAENKQADAPMRALIAERMNADPGAAGDPRSFCQFGPLPIELMRPFMALDDDARRSSRLLSLVVGIAVFVPFFALGRRLLGAAGSRVASSGGVAVAGAVAVRGRELEPALVLAGLALALSPLHIQVSITAASEALYLLLFLAALERLHAAVTGARRRDFLTAGLLASLAAVTRYDTWLALPIACAAVLAVGRRDRRGVLDVAVFAGASALLPLGYLIWSWDTSGDPFFFARYITRDHAEIAQAVAARLGGGLARLRQVGIWLVSFAAAMTPVPFLASAGAARRWRAWSPPNRVVLSTALAPTLLYVVKGLLFGDFEPLPRFAIAPGAVMLPLASAALLSVLMRWSGRSPRSPLPPGWKATITCPIALTGFGTALLSAVVLALAFARSGRIWAGAESVAPLTRLDGEDRELARYLLAHRRKDESAFIDTFGYVDIAITHAARIPASLSASLARTRHPGKTLAESRAVTGASWFAIHDLSWGKVPVPDWPADSTRFGHWRLAHVTGPTVASKSVEEHR